MATDGWRIEPLGDTALLVSGPGAQALAALAARLERAQRQQHAPAWMRGVQGWTLGLDTLLVCYDPLVAQVAALRQGLRRQLGRSSAGSADAAPLVEIPVLYGGAHGPDLAAVAAEVGLSMDEVVALHCGGSYHVLMIGFAPGFPYIGGLPAPLHLPRRAVPRTHVPIGSVAIAGDMVGIYPQRSPGGWHLIGRTPLQMFDPQRDPPALLRVGDLVRFVPA